MLSEAATSLPSRSTTRSWVALPSLATWISYAPAARLSSSRAMLKSASVAVIDSASCGPDDADSCGPDDAAAEVGAGGDWLDDAPAESDGWVAWASVSSDPPPHALTDRASRTAAAPVVRLRWVKPDLLPECGLRGWVAVLDAETATLQYLAEALPTPPDHGLQHLAVHRL